MPLAEGDRMESNMMITDIRMIYDYLRDEISRRLFTARLNVSATGDARIHYNASGSV